MSDRDVEPGPCVLAGLRIWDGEADGPLASADAIRIEGRRIVAIGPVGEISSGARVERFDGATAIPGLCDAHVHMTLDPDIRTPDEQLARSDEEVIGQMEARALAMLRAGITTARDLGGGAWLELALRDRIARGQVPGPRLLCAGQPITSPGGHCHFWGGEAQGEEQIRSVVQRQVEHGADCIKVMATGGVLTKGTSIREAQFTSQELGFVVDEARRHGREVAAHCHATAGIRNAASAGVRTVEHCSWAGDKGFGSDVDPDAVRGLAESGAWVSPTVNAGWRRFLATETTETKGTTETAEAKEAAQKAREASQRFAEGMRGAFRELRSAGVGLIASTDAGIPRVRHDGLAKALPVLAEFAGLEPVEVLRTATSNAARALELDSVTGRLAPGLEADLLILDGNPLEDLTALERLIAIRAAGSAPPTEPGP